MLFILAVLLGIVAGAIVYQNINHTSKFIRLCGGIAAGILAYLATYFVAARI